MATKKTKKTTKRLQKGKKLEATKPLRKAKANEQEFLPVRMDDVIITGS